MISSTLAWRKRLLNEWSKQSVDQPVSTNDENVTGEPPLEASDDVDEMMKTAYAEQPRPPHVTGSGWTLHDASTLCADQPVFTDDEEEDIGELRMATRAEVDEMITRLRSEIRDINRAAKE